MKKLLITILSICCPLFVFSQDIEIDGKAKIQIMVPDLTRDSVVVWQSDGTLAIRSGHTATQNINLNGNYLSGDGDTEGVFVSSDGKVGIGNAGPSERLHVSGGVRSGIGVLNGSSIAKADARAGYMVIVSGNFGGGSQVRSAIYHLVTTNEGDAIAFSTVVSNLNSQTATFSVTAGGLIAIDGLPPGNHQVGVFRN